MPKELAPSGWVETECLFRQRPVDVCTLCERPFSLLNRQRHCAFCGRVFHRRDCSSRRGLGSLRACTHCDDYRSMLRDKLTEGELFECVSEGLPVRLSLYEGTAELILHWTSFGMKETVDLLAVELRKGFTSQPKYGVYEPLKSASLVMRGGSPSQPKVLNIKAPNAWTCQLWADGLKAAQYVYRCMLHQERTRLHYLERGVGSCWFTTRYLIDDLTPHISQPHTLPPTQHTTSTSPPTQHTPTIRTSPPTKRLFMSVDSGYNSDMRSLEVKGHRGSLPIWLSASSLDSPPRTHSWHDRHSSHTFPYRYSPLSELCRCHDYEVIPSRSIDVRSKVSPPYPQRRCCRQCVDTCKVAEDLDNL